MDSVVQLNNDFDVLNSEGIGQVERPQSEVTVADAAMKYS